MESCLSADRPEEAEEDEDEHAAQRGPQVPAEEDGESDF